MPRNSTLVFGSSCLENKTMLFLLEEGCIVDHGNGVSQYPHEIHHSIASGVPTKNQKCSGKKKTDHNLTVHKFPCLPKKVPQKKKRNGCFFQHRLLRPARVADPPKVHLFGGKWDLGSNNNFEISPFSMRQSPQNTKKKV